MFRTLWTVRSLPLFIILKEATNTRGINVESPLARASKCMGAVDSR